MLARTIGWLCEGQIEELRHTYDRSRTEESYLRSIHGKTASLWDRLPKGAIFVTTLVAQAQSQIKTHCDNIIEAAGQGSAEAAQASIQAHAAKDSIAAGRYLYPAFSGLYVRGLTEEELARNTQRAAPGMSNVRILISARSSKDSLNR